MFKLVVILCLVAAASAAENNAVVEEEPAAEEETGLTAFPLPSDFPMDSFVRAISLAGAVMTGFAGLIALVSYVIPLMGFRMCYLFGNCEPEGTAYNAATGPSYDHHGYTGYNYGAGFRKRSLTYLGPILQTLTEAYKKYAPKEHQRSLVEHAPPK